MIFKGIFLFLTIGSQFHQIVGEKQSPSTGLEVIEGNLFESDGTTTALESYTGEPTLRLFYKDHVVPSKPVVFPSLDLSKLQLENLKSSGLAALSFVETLSHHQQMMSIRQLAMMEGKRSYRGSLHRYFKSIIQLPRCLQCSYLVPLLESTVHTLTLNDTVTPQMRDQLDSITCLAEGEAQFIIGHERNDGSRDRFSTNLSTGKCIYIPAGWSYQKKISELENSVMIRWKRGDWEPNDKCIKDISPSAPLSVYSFPGDSYVGILKSLNQLDKLLGRVDKLLAWMMKDSRTFSHLELELIRNEDIIEKLQEWTWECRARARELFSTLDLDGDQVVGPKDIDLLSENNVLRFLDYLEDRLMDFYDIVPDQITDRNEKNKPYLDRSDVTRAFLEVNKELSSHDEL